MFKELMQMIVTKTGVLSQHRWIFLKGFNCCSKMVGVYQEPGVYEEHLTDRMNCV